MEFVKLAGPAGMFFIMFSLALSLKTSAFKAIVSNPLSFYLGLVLQLIGMPLIGFVIALSVPFPVEVKVGIVLITCLPSAVTSNYLSKKMGGDVALSISLTAVSSLIAFLTIPIIIKIYFYFVIQDQSIIIFQTSLIGTSFKLFAIVTIPVILGIIFNTIFDEFSKKIDPIFDKLSLIVFLFIIGVAVYQDLYLIPEYIRYAGIKTILIFIIAFIMCIALSKLFKLNEKDKITVTLETTLQNGGIGIVIGALMFDNPKFIFPVAAYALLQYLFILIYYSFVRFKKGYEKY
ncbi:bile acid:sodium symporter family protein [Candidatus Pelagibacter communis]|uniref:bile acid:sodium symporter family protein n=1 Tax=Pelagibacter ubique TaxID=198252 RepID=UPI00094CF267|nr:bile acid:sodium symporter family protein [Candidatus Pelagibacter ubique]